MESEKKNYNYILVEKNIRIVYNILDITDIYDVNKEVYIYFYALVQNLKKDEVLFNKCFLLYKEEGVKMWEYNEINESLKSDIILSLLKEEENEN